MNKDSLKTNLIIPQNYFARAVSNLRLGGIAIYDIKQPVFKYIYFIYSIFMLTVFVYVFTISEIIHIIENLADVEGLLFTMSYLVGHFIGCAKITVLLVKKKSIGNFLQSLNKGRFLPNINRGGLQEINIIQEAISNNTIQARAWWIIIFVMLSNRMIWIIKNPILEYISPENSNITVTIRQLPYATSYLIQFDIHKSPFYELIFIHQCISIWIFGWYMGNADTITNGFIIHLAAQFKIVANAFLTVHKRTEESTNKCNVVKALNKLQKTTGKNVLQKYDENFLKNLKELLIECIQHHQEVLNLAENMENTFNLMLLMQVLGSLSLYGIQLYQLSLLPIKSTSFISMSFFLLAMISQLLCFCWNGNELTIASEAVADAAYNVKWIAADKAAKDLILMTILRAQRPVYITAGKFTNLSMATFAAILRGSLSYFTLLRKVNDVAEE